MFGRQMRCLLIRLAPLLWVAALAAAITDRHMKLVVVLNGMAFAGTILGAMRERRDDETARLARLLADATKEPGSTRSHLHEVRSR